VKKSAKKNAQRARRPSAVFTAVKWAVGLAVVGLIVYGLSQSSGVAFDEEDISVVDFSGLDDDQKLDALREANRARCVCGCGMNLAQCVATDMTCPIRERNVERIRTMVRMRS
jgi:hypothetical protein